VISSSGIRVGGGLFDPHRIFEELPELRGDDLESAAGSAISAGAPNSAMASRNEMISPPTIRGQHQRQRYAPRGAQCPGAKDVGGILHLA